MRYVGLTLVVCLLALTAFIPGCGKKPAPTSNVTSTQTKTPPPPEAKSPPPPEAKSPPPPPSAKGAKRESKPPDFRDILQDELGMPIYPGAKQQNFNIGSDSDGNKVVVASLTTRDSFDKVMAFYRESLLGYKESTAKLIKGSHFSGFRRSFGKKSELIVIESPPGKPTKIDVTVTKPPQQ